MEDYSKKTNQELLTEFNKIADKHAQLKLELNEKLEQMEKLEEEYAKIAEVIIKRNK